MKRYLLYTMVFLGLFFPSLSLANTTVVSEPATKAIKATELPWAVLGYWGRTTNDTLGSILGLSYTTNEETIYSLELTRVLSPENAFRRFFQPFVSTVELNANFSYRDDPAGPIYEFNPYFSVRWANFPWNNIVPTTIAIGEGLSYDSSVPSVEQKDDADDTNNLLNYIMMEVTFALPKYPQLELSLRAHHRSGVFGLYNSENSGSTAVGLGIRYRF